MMNISITIDHADLVRMSGDLRNKRPFDVQLSIDGRRYYDASIRLRGDGSLRYPRKGYHIQYVDESQRLNSIDLSAIYGDKSLIRERLSFELFADVGQLSSDVWHVYLEFRTPRGHLIDQGVFIGLEHVDAQFFARRERRIGTLYSADGKIIDGQFAGSWLCADELPHVNLLYKKIHPSERKENTCLRNFIRKINDIYPSESSTQLSQLVDIENVISWCAINALIQNTDVYHKNYYLHKRPEDNKWEVIPWDLDLTFGRKWSPSKGALHERLVNDVPIKSAALMHNCLTRHVALNDRYFSELQARLLKLLQTAFFSDRLFTRIDAIYLEISAAVYSDTNKYPTDKDYEQEKTVIKKWIRKRRGIIYSQLL